MLWPNKANSAGKNLNATRINMKECPPNRQIRLRINSLLLDHLKNLHPDFPSKESVANQRSAVF